jgi:hypothetical protein
MQGHQHLALITASELGTEKGQDPFELAINEARPLGFEEIAGGREEAICKLLGDMAEEPEDELAMAAELGDGLAKWVRPEAFIALRH